MGTIKAFSEQECGLRFCFVVCCVCWLAQFIHSVYPPAQRQPNERDLEVTIIRLPLPLMSVLVRCYGWVVALVVITFRLMTLVARSLLVVSGSRQKEMAGFRG